MQQVLFNIPILRSWFPPDGIPVYGFGAMLFITFVACTIWATRRGKAVGMPPERVQDMVIWLFVSGIVGARVLYMIQKHREFPDKDPISLLTSFFQIWKGGIIFYGSAFGGALGYGLFYWYVVRRLKVSGWQLADAMAPILALGLAIGRIGCYLNGCCWGQVAAEEVCPVPLGAAHFPLLPAHSQKQLVTQSEDVPYGYLQTSTGFSVVPRDRSALGIDPRTVVLAVERDSPAANAGLLPGDRIVEVNGRKNLFVVEVLGSGDGPAKAIEILRKNAIRIDDTNPERPVRAYFDEFSDFAPAVLDVRGKVPGVTLVESDSLSELVRDWPRGKSTLELKVDRPGQPEPISLQFTPVTVGLYPTQLYETLSMVLLIVLLLAFYPFRRHDGQLMTLCMIGYAVHRFINESLRIEPVEGLGLTLSQWGSVAIFAGAVGMEAYLWRAMPSRWKTAPEAKPT